MLPRRFGQRLALAALACLLPGAALAHAGHGDAGGLTHGFMHPVTGFDHVLAMVAVGILAWQLGGRALWLVPAAFVCLMAVGGTLGIAGIGIPFVELGIALSVVVLGAAVAAGMRLPPALAMGLVGFFAIFHGHAHGTEMPETASGLAYGLGFMIATALLHAAGIGSGLVVGKHGSAGTRVIGGMIALLGLGTLGGAI